MPTKTKRRKVTKARAKKTLAEDDELVQEIASLVCVSFHTFGGNKPMDGNPITAALEGNPPMFALGVDVAHVVRFVLATVDMKRSR